MSEIIGFVGGGKMAEALIHGVCSSGLASPGSIYVADTEQSRRDFLKDTYKVKVFDKASEVTEKSNFVVLAVKPQVMSIVLEDIKHTIKDSHLIVSIAAGITISFIEKHLGDCACRLVRVMPNTPALVREGATAISPGDKSTESDIAKVRQLFDAVGKTVVLAESYLDAVTGLSGSGPAYVFNFLEGLIDAGVKVGLPREEAQVLVMQTVLGSVKLAMETQKHPAELTSMVTSPGGTTIAGLHELARAGFHGILMDAVESATNRSKELGG